MAATGRNLTPAVEAYDEIGGQLLAALLGGHESHLLADWGPRSFRTRPG